MTVSSASLWAPLVGHNFLHQLSSAQAAVRHQEPLQQWRWSQQLFCLPSFIKVCRHLSCLSHEWVQDPPWCQRAAQPASCPRRWWSRGLHRPPAETQDSLRHNHSVCSQRQGGCHTLRGLWCNLQAMGQSWGMREMHHNVLMLMSSCTFADITAQHSV